MVIHYMISDPWSVERNTVTLERFNELYPMAAAIFAADDSVERVMIDGELYRLTADKSST